MKNLFRILILISIGLFLNSCYYDSFPEVEEPDITPPNPDEPVSYSEQIQPIWDSKCVFCHNGNEPPDLRPEVSYDVLTTEGWVVKGDADSSILYKSLLGVDGVPLMPPGQKLPDEQIGWVEEWINDGAPDN